MVALALDIGETRIGIAVSDRSGRVASPVKVLPAAEVIGLAKSFLYIVEDYEPDVLVSGRPMTMAGERGPQAERVEAQAQKIADALDLLKRRAIGGKHRVERAEFFHQPVRDGVRILPRHGVVKEKLKHLVVGERIEPVGAELLFFA